MSCAGRATRCRITAWPGCWPPSWTTACRATPRPWTAPSTADSNAQFEYISAAVTAHLTAGEPAISVSAKNKELIGAYASKGRTWRPAGDPERINTHDFPDKDLGKAVPYGVHDIGADAGWPPTAVTPAPPSSPSRPWWAAVGGPACPGATRLLISADAGGSKRYWLRPCKTELARLTGETVLAITAGTCRPEPPSGTKSSKGCSPTSR